MSQKDFFDKLHDRSTEIDYIQKEVEETIELLKQKTNKVKQQEQKIKKLEKSNSLKKALKGMTVKRILMAVWRRVKKTTKSSDSSCGFVFDETLYATENVAFPTKETSFMWMNERLQVLQELEDILLNKSDCRSTRDKVLKSILAQNDLIYQFYQQSEKDVQDEIRYLVNAYEGMFLKKMLFSEKKGIAFCYNFSPTADTSAYVAARRLKQVNKQEKENINWTVVTKDSSASHDQDMQYKSYYADFVCSEWKVFGGRFNFAAREQFYFAKSAINRTRDMKADYIYSRSMHPASHLVAYMYKLEHPEVVWYAEFGDPISRTADLLERKEVLKDVWVGEEAFLTELYEACEKVVYDHADHIIFTNAIQQKYMLSYNPRPELNDSIVERGFVWAHPMIEKEMLKVGDVSYKMDESKINIGYFGRFYPNRSIDDMLALLKNEKVNVHIFALNTKDIKHLASDRVKINSALPYLDFLKVASKMDYLFLNDMKSDLGIIPWLPSKLSDYLASGAKIIGKYIDGSPMSMIEHDNLIKVKEITEELSMALVKGE